MIKNKIRKKNKNYLNFSHWLKFSNLCTNRYRSQFKILARNFVRKKKQQPSIEKVTTQEKRQQFTL